VADLCTSLDASIAPKSNASRSSRSATLPADAGLGDAEQAGGRGELPRPTSREELQIVQVPYRHCTRTLSRIVTPLQAAEVPVGNVLSLRAPTSLPSKVERLSLVGERSGPLIAVTTRRPTLAYFTACFVSEAGELTYPEKIVKADIRFIISAFLLGLDARQNPQ